MDVKKLLSGTLLGGVVYFFAGWAIYGILMKDQMAIPDVQYAEEDFKIGMMALSCFVWGLLLTFIFLNWAGISTFLGGLKGGAIVGALVALSLGLAFTAEYTFGSIERTAYDTIGTIICSGLAGGAIGWVLGKMKD